MVQRVNFPNSDAREVRRRFQEAAAKIKWLVPEGYAGVATSPLRATVNPVPNTIDFDVAP